MSNVLELAKQVARIDQLASSSGGGGSFLSSSSATSSSSTTALTTEGDNDEQQLASLSEHLRAVVPREKLLRQSKVFKIPSWVTTPTVALHLECRRDGTVMAPLALHEYPFYLMGNSSDCDFRPGHPSISREHCALAFHGEQRCFVVVDLHSKNGVLVNGKRISPGVPTPLPVGSVLQLGSSNRVYEMKRGRAEKGETSSVLLPSSLSSTVVVPPPATPLPRQQQQPSAASVVASKRSRSGEPIIATTDDDAVRRKEPTQMSSLAPPPPLPPTAAATTTTTTTTTAIIVPASAAAAVTVGLSAPQPPPSPEPLLLHHHSDDRPRQLRHILLKHKDAKNPKSLNPSNKGTMIDRSLEEALDLAKSIRSLHAVWTVERFSDAALRFSECGSSKKGGDLGVVKRGDFMDSFERRVFGLLEGEISEPFETPLGVHLVMCCGVVAAPHDGGSVAST